MNDFELSFIKNMGIFLTRHGSLITDHDMGLARGKERLGALGFGRVKQQAFLNISSLFSIAAEWHARR